MTIYQSLGATIRRADESVHGRCRPRKAALNKINRKLVLNKTGELTTQMYGIVAILSCGLPGST